MKRSNPTQGPSPPGVGRGATSNGRCKTCTRPTSSQPGYPPHLDARWWTDQPNPVLQAVTNPSSTPTRPRRTGDNTRRPNGAATPQRPLGLSNLMDDDPTSTTKEEKRSRATKKKTSIHPLTPTMVPTQRPPERQQQVGSTLSGQAWPPESAASVLSDKPGSTRTQQPTRQLHPPRQPAAASTPSTSAYQDPSPSPRMRPALQRHNPPGSRPQDATDPSTAAPRLIKSKRLQCRLATKPLRNQRLYGCTALEEDNIQTSQGSAADGSIDRDRDADGGV